MRPLKVQVWVALWHCTVVVVPTRVATNVYWVAPDTVDDVARAVVGPVATTLTRVGDDRPDWVSVTGAEGRDWVPSWRLATTVRVYLQP